MNSMSRGMNILFTLNGRAASLDAPPDRRVVDLLREDSGFGNLHVIFKSSIFVKVSNVYIIEERRSRTRGMSCIAGMVAMTIRGNIGIQDLLPIIKNEKSGIFVKSG